MPAIMSRDERAEAVLARFNEWSPVFDTDGNPKCWAVPSMTETHLTYLTTHESCTCLAGQKGIHCQHSRAVLLHIRQFAPDIV